MCPILWIYAGFYSSRCQTDSHLRPLLGLNFENWLITQDQRACSDASTTVQPRSIRCCRCVHFHLHVIQPTQGRFQLFLLAVNTLGSYLMSDDTPIFSVDWTLCGISKCRFLVRTAKEAQFCEFAVSAIAVSDFCCQRPVLKRRTEPMSSRSS